MSRRNNLLALLAAGLVTVLAVAGFSTAASSAKPSPTQEPNISGTAQEGQTLRASTGTFNGTAPITYAYRWLRCNAQGNGCSNIGGATSSTYQVKSGDVGHRLRVRVTATNSDGSATSTSNETAVVTAATAPPPPVVNGCPAGNGPVDVSQVSLPARLVIDGQSASPATITRSTQDITLRFHVSACNGRPVTGALIYATAVPFQQFSVAAETPTGADGWATLTEHRLSAFPASPRQQLLAVFVRARKSSDPIVAGISARLLVSFPVRLNG